MIGGVVARRYGKALLELGVETGQLDTIVKDLNALAEMMEGSAELRDVSENPQVSNEARKAVFTDIANRMSVNVLSRNALLLLIDNGRLRALPNIARALREESDKRAGVVRAHVTSASPLNESYVQRLQAALEARFKKKVVVQRSVDPNLIAGVVTRVGDTIIDGSVRARLNELKTELMPQ